jgi:dTDP-4-dehydrorhamnose 3,5-epimerase/reductase
MDEKTFVIVGSNGQLGKALQAQYPDAQAVDSDALDITNKDAVNAFDWSNVSTIFNAAAYTNVDGAESPEGRLAAWKVNAYGVSNLARVAAKHDITLIHISTEYAFDGTQENHKEDEPFSPLSVYGSSKVAGDIAVSLAPKHYICRTTWLIGEGKNFVRTMIGLGQKGIAPSVVSDQVGRLTFTTELVQIIDYLLKSGAPFGTYNTTNGGEPASWADVTREIFKDGNFDLQVTDTTTEAYFTDKPAAAKRPLNSVLDLTKLIQTGFNSRDWRNDLEEYVAKELEQS